MKVSELFKQLSYGQLSNLSIGLDGSGAIKQEAIPKLILYINESLLRIYSKYLLKECSIIIQELEHITNYHLLSKYAESSQSTERYKYIKDLPNEPFQEDVIKILKVYDSTGRKRPLNDTEDRNSLFTPEPSTLQVPSPISGQALSITYQARHIRLNYEGEGVLDQVIVLPFFLENALQFLVASRVYSDMNGQENKITSQEHLTNYQLICAELEEKDLVNNTHQTSHKKLEQRGFV